MISSSDLEHNGVSPKIIIDRLGKRYPLGSGIVVALDSFSLNVQEGEFVCLVGPSGCGKTTLLRILAGLDKPSSGSVSIQQRDPQRPLATMVFQENSIFPWLRVRDNVAYGLTLRGVDGVARASTVARIIELAGLARFADAWPHQLSGGMKQRVSVARTFANDPEILLMDEPFAALDEQNKIVLQQELLRLWSNSRKTVLFITHSIDEALMLADRVIVMSGRPGRIIVELAVDFPRPRLLHELKTTAQFSSLWQEIWRLLEKRGAIGEAA